MEGTEWAGKREGEARGSLLGYSGAIGGYGMEGLENTVVWCLRCGLMGQYSLHLQAL